MHVLLHEEDPVHLLSYLPPNGFGTPNCSLTSCSYCGWKVGCKNVSKADVQGWQHNIREHLKRNPLAFPSSGSCAVVGSASRLIMGGLGSEIDAHDHIIRVGEKAGHPAHIGRRTTILLRSMVVPPGQSTPHHAKLLLYCPVEQAGGKAGIGRCWKHLRLPNLAHFARVNPLMVHEAQVDMEAPFQPSPQAMAAFLAIRRCSSVTIYAFGDGSFGGRAADMYPLETAETKWLLRMSRNKVLTWRLDAFLSTPNLTCSSLVDQFHNPNISPIVSTYGRSRGHPCLPGSEWQSCDLRPPCLVFSIGIGKDWAFDRAAAAKGCEVHSFDPTISLYASHRRAAAKFRGKLRGSIHFHLEGLGGHGALNYSGYYSRGTAGGCLGSNGGMPACLAPIHCPPSRSPLGQSLDCSRMAGLARVSHLDELLSRYAAGRRVDVLKIDCAPASRRKNPAPTSNGSTPFSAILSSPK